MAIKAAYRNLAKRYHPDRSGDPNTRYAFIEVNEAYEILMRRDEYVRDAIRRYQSKQTRYQRYGTSKGHDPKRRAETYADMRFAQFEKSPIYRTARVVNSASDYIFVFMGAVMIVSPFVGYFGEPEVPLLPGETQDFQFLPVFLGISFLFGIWYFLFRKPA